MDLFPIVLFVLFFLGLLFVLLLTKEEFPKWVYCIMITGKDDNRIQLAKQSVRNFLEQDYKYKKLIIINHHEKSINMESDNVFEFQVPKKGNTLGDLRNIALQLVPIDAIWTVWDDDDYRSPNYLSLLYSQMKRYNVDVVCFTNRYEYNANTNFVWEMSLLTGFVTVFAKQDLRIRYLEKDSMEDLNLIDDFKKLKKKILIYNNDPSIYIRLVHSNNTSQYVEKNKTTTNQISSNSGYLEKQVDNVTRERVITIMGGAHF